MKNFNKYILFTYFAVLFLFTCCTRNGLTPEEYSRVTKNDKDEKMPLLTIFSPKDSLFLRNEVRKINKEQIVSPTIKHLKSRMFATVSDSTNGGVGLAAPQVGIGVSMILVQRFDKENDPFEVYFNPKIEEYGDSINSGTEGCLSIPGYRGLVERSQNIKISYYDSLGEKMKEDINGFTAVIFQHEIDHLNGVFYYDHIFGGFNSLVHSDE